MSDGTQEPTGQPVTQHEMSGAHPQDAEDAPTLARRVRAGVEDAWKEGCRLAETVLDTLVLPPGGFSALAVGWLTTLAFFGLSVLIGAVIGLGGLILFFGLECLALAAYAFPGALFLFSVAGGVVPALVLFWFAHTLFGIEGDWTAWGAYPLLLTGLFGSYYYWRFGRVIAATGESALAFYRGAAPKAAEIFGAPFAILSGVWSIVKRVLGLLRNVANEFLDLLRGRRPTKSEGGPAPSPPEGPNAD